MLARLKKLNLVNEGYKRVSYISDIFLNTNNIVSIVDYQEINDFLIKEENNDHAKKSFSLVKVNEGNNIQELIILGTAKEVYASINSSTEKKKRILNG